MTINSMTGFARGEGSCGALGWYWELKSVNGKGLDIRLRLPPGLDQLDPHIRAAIKARISRGSLQVSLQVQRENRTPELRVNTEILQAMLAAAEGLGVKDGLAPPSIDGLLALKGVVEIVEQEEEEGRAEAQLEALRASFDETLGKLAAARAEEGAHIAAVLEGQLRVIADLRERAAASPARRPEAIRERLAAQISRLLETSDGFDPDRLHQEAVLLATKADIQEELDRLSAHVAAARDLIAAEGASGRRMEFLAQEFNRESNTLCAKANDTELSNIGLELKAVVDQFREQVLNVE
ncbi:MAG TPA: YicC family protein [Hyphomicrobiales bacterium]|nr:YicC family protein [Hyphomicrobiales bacterium]